MILVERDYRLVGKVVSVAHSLEWIHDGGKPVSVTRSPKWIVRLGLWSCLYLCTW